MPSTIAEFQNFLIAFKGLQDTVPLKNKKDGTSLLEEVASLYPEVLSVCGKNPWEGGALHRLDHDTTGFVLFARNQAFYDWIWKIQEEDRFVKYYEATCNILEGAEPEKKKVVSYFRAFGPKGKMVKPEFTPQKADSERLYRTDLEVIEKLQDTVRFRCTIARGFRHQIRTHLASIGCPIVGDKLYNPKASDKPLMLKCIGFEFPLEDGSQFVY